MNKPKIEKMILLSGAKGDELPKAIKLLQAISGKKPSITRAKKRIPVFGTRPGLEIGCIVTLRGNEVIPLLKKLLEAKEKKIPKKSIVTNNFSFGIAEYIEIPGVEYQRDIGIRGLQVTVVFSRSGRRVLFKKIKRGRLPAKQRVTPEEIREYIEKNLNVEVLEK